MPENWICAVWFAGAVGALQAEGTAPGVPLPAQPLEKVVTGDERPAARQQQASVVHRAGEAPPVLQQSKPKAVINGKLNVLEKPLLLGLCDGS